MTTRQANLPALTGLRFLAALHAFLFHVLTPRFAGEPGSAEGWVVRLIGGGYVAVSLFFVLSGFILAYVYLRPADGDDVPAEAMRGTRHAFLWARVARVYPVYLVALLVSAPLFAITTWRAGRADLGAAIATVLTAPFALQGWSPATACRWNCPGWSLSVEAFLYFVFPSVGVWLCGLRSRTRWRVAIVVWLAGLALPAAYAWVTPRTGPGTAHVWLDVLKYAPPAHIGEFVAGIVIGLAFVDRQERAVPAWGRVLPGGSLIAVGLILAASDRIPYPLLHNGLLVPVWGTLIVGLAWQQGVLARVLAHPLATWLGESSYSFYLLHLSILSYLLAAAARVPALGRLATGPWVALVFFVALAAATAAYHWIEEPARRAIRARVAPPAELLLGAPAVRA